jgi:hypothetical protein
VEEIHQIGEILSSINTTYISVIPKMDFPNNFDEFHLFSLCNFLYKIITKVIEVKLKPILSNVISSE